MRIALRVVLLVALGIAASRPAAAACQLGGSACGDPAAIDCNGGAVCFPPWRTCSGCTCTTTSSGRTCLPTSQQPGAVSTLLVDRSVTSPGELELSWSASCAAADADYAIHEGQFGVWYSHAPLRCTSAGALSLTVVPSSGDRYYLIAAIRTEFTGSLGTNGSGSQRPDGEPSCTTDRAIAPCP